MLLNDLWPAHRAHGTIILCYDPRWPWQFSQSRGIKAVINFPEARGYATLRTDHFSMWQHHHQNSPEATAQATVVGSSLKKLTATSLLRLNLPVLNEPDGPFSLPGKGN